MKKYIYILYIIPFLTFGQPFGEGRLFKKVRRKELPPWTIEEGMSIWSAFFLKFIISHTAVTCVIHATSNPNHAIDNFNSDNGNIPELSIRNRMIAYMNTI